MRRALLSASSVLALSLAMSPGPALAAGVGSVAAVNRDLDGRPPGAPLRTLLLGDKVIRNERITSSDEGSGQILFRDQTTITVSPNSDIVLDEYVYDPDADTGEIGLTVARGVLRVIGGRATKKNDAVIRTPTATIGIRGGIAVVSVDAAGVTSVMHVAGDYTRVMAGGETLVLSRANAYATIESESAPTYEGVATDDHVATVYGGSQGGDGGASADPEEAEVLTATLAPTNSETPGAARSQPISTAGEKPAEDRSTRTREETIATDSDVQTTVTEEARPEPEPDTPTGPDRGPDGDPPPDDPAPDAPDPDPDPQPTPEPEPEPDPEPDVTLDPDPDPQPDPEPEPDPEPVPEPDPEPDLEPDPTPDPEPGPDPEPDPEPEPEPEPEVVLDTFIGGALLSVDGVGFTDDFGVQIDPADLGRFIHTGDSVAFEEIRRGSLIGVDSGGEVARFPAPDTTGVFTFSAAEATTPVGGVSGSGFADPANDLFFYYFETDEEMRGVALFAEPGPTQLVAENVGDPNVRVTPYRVLPDLHLTSDITEAPFLPAGLGSLVSNGVETTIFMITPPDQPTFAPGAGRPSSTGTRALLPFFSVSGTAEDQTYAMYVGAAPVLNTGAGAPALTLSTTGVFRQPGVPTPFEIRSRIGSTSFETPEGDATVFGAGDNYFLLGNSSHYLGGLDAPGEVTAASVLTDVETRAITAFGSTNLAERLPAEFLDPGTRIGIGSGPGAFAAETGLIDAGDIFGGQAQYLSYGYGANSGVLVDAMGNAENFLIRTAGFDEGVTAAFSTNTGGAALVLPLDEVASTEPLGLLGARFFFGGERSAVIDHTAFGLREHEDPVRLEGVLAPPLQSVNVVQTTIGDDFGATVFPGDPSSPVGFAGALLGHGLAPTEDVFPIGVVSTPEYLTWGWWTGQYSFEDFGSVSALDNARIQFGLGAWVAGDRTDVLPTAGPATYAGAVVVSGLTPGGGGFVDGGRFDLEWDFGDRVGQATFTDVLALPQFSVDVDESFALSTANDYSGFASVPGPGGPASVGVDGSFFDGPAANDARATAGSIRIDGAAGPLATGVFFGER